MDSWVDAVELLRQELSSELSAEDDVISVSLHAIPGKKAAAIRTLLRSFALVPEDVGCPLEVLQWIYEAETGSDAAEVPPILELRRWTKLLIDRALVLGPVDKPSLHDIVTPSLYHDQKSELTAIYLRF